MKVPLIADSSHRTVNKQTGAQQVILWSRGDKLVIKSPRTHSYYIPNAEGDSYRVLGKTKRVRYNKYNVENIGELGVDKLPPHAHLDGVTRNEVERISIEHPEFFGKFTSPHVKTMCFDIETYSSDSTFPFEKHTLLYLLVLKRMTISIRYFFGTVIMKMMSPVYKDS